MKKNTTLNIQGKSRKTYVFHTYKLPAKLTAVGGVFLYLKLLKNGDFDIVKIGTTHSFEDEMRDFDSMKKSGATHITALQKNGKAKQDLIYKDLLYLKKRR